MILILIDDMGYGDLGVTGNRDVPTPNIDRLAADGIRFVQFYVASPICSPSRVGITTGQYPARHLIHSYISSRERNRSRGMGDFLDPEVPTLARVFQAAGYATAHFGKWHMGGGRDVGDAPLPAAYGFDQSLVSFEGLGDRILIEGDGLSEQSAALGRGAIRWMPKHRQTESYVDRSIEFLRDNVDRSAYLQLWLNDVHDRHEPSASQLARFERFSANPYLQRYWAVLDETDRQIGRLVDEVDRLGLAERTLIVLTSDNGPTAWPRYYEEGFEPPGSTAGLRGRKWSLYEGGIRTPLIARWTGRIPAGALDETSVLTSVDLFLSLCRLAGLEPPHVDFDGEDVSGALLGRPRTRKRPIIWEYGRDETYLRPGLEDDRSPDLAIREGRWKLLVNGDGSRLELYDLDASTAERENLAAQHPEVAERLSQRLLAWREGLPVLE